MARTIPLNCMLDDLEGSKRVEVAIMDRVLSMCGGLRNSLWKEKRSSRLFILEDRNRKESYANLK